jgi:hypothetical protein
MVDRQGVDFNAAEVHHGDSEVHFAGYWDSGDRSDIEEMPELHLCGGRLWVESQPGR